MTDDQIGDSDSTPVSTGLTRQRSVQSTGHSNDMSEDNTPDLPKLPDMIEGEDLAEMFKGAVPVTITITTANDMMAILHAIIRMMVGGDVNMANSFLATVTERSKLVSVHVAVVEAIRALSQTCGEPPPACLKPLLIHVLDYSLNPENQKAFSQYMADKKSKGEQ